MKIQIDFKSEYNSLTGQARFKIGDYTREMHFDKFDDYHKVSNLLDEARKVGAQDAAKEFAWRVKNMVRDMGVES